MPTILPHLWYDKEAKEAAEFYTSIFPESKITHASVIHNTPSGDCDIVSFNVWGQPFMAISAGPYFKINPSISMMVNFDPSRDPEARKHLDEIWNKLMDGGTALMPLDKYDFSEHYGWVQDKFGLSWQLILTNPKGEPRPTIIPSLMFANESMGKAEEATDFYLSVFKDGKRGALVHYPTEKASEKKMVMFTDFKLLDMWFAAMDAPGEHKFAFNEAISLLVSCDTQEEIDYYWSKLSAVPEAEQCGWLKDKFGVSWQITASMMEKIYAENDSKKIDRVTQAFLKMKKFDIAELEKATKG